MKRIARFGEVVTERMGVSTSVMDQAREIHKTISSARDRFVFRFDFVSGGRPCPIRVSVDSTFANAGQFQSGAFPPTVVVRDRDNFEVLAHELKHADRFFRMGTRAYEEDYSEMYGISGFMKTNSLLPFRHRNLFFLFYFLQREEFEAYYHSDWVRFSRLVEQDRPGTKDEVMRLWRDSDKTIAWQVYTGNLREGSVVSGATGKLNMDVPKQQRPFKFANWCSQSVIDSVIWAYIKQRRGIPEQDGLLMKIIRAVTPETVLSGLDAFKGPPEKYRAEVARLRAKLEAQIERTMEEYTRKYARIPALAVMSLKK